MAATASAAVNRAIGNTPSPRPRVRRPAAQKLDGRTREGRFIRDARTRLLATLGPRPTAQQSLLVEQIVGLRYRVWLIEQTVDSGRPVTEHANRYYAGLANSLVRALAQLQRTIENAPKVPTPPLPWHAAAAA